MSVTIPNDLLEAAHLSEDELRLEIAYDREELEEDLDTLRDLNRL